MFSEACITREYLGPLAAWGAPQGLRSRAQRFPRGHLGLILATGALTLLVLAGCRGYQIGNGSLFRPDVRTVHVPVFESDSYRRYLGERLTEAVVKEIERRTPYKVVAANGADSVLSGRIVSDAKHTVGENAFDEARAIELKFHVQMTWVDRRGISLINSRALPVPTAALNLAQNSSLVPEGGQSIATAQLAAIENLAQQIVNQMEMAW